MCLNSSGLSCVFYVHSCAFWLVIIELLTQFRIVLTEDSTERVLCPSKL